MLYVAAGEVNVETGEAIEMLVDGQQRITTLYQYFTGSEDLKLSANVKPYSELSNEAKEQFLQYDAVVRDLGRVDIEQIREVFRRINATQYSLNAMEIHNARYEGALKAFAEKMAQRQFFESHRIFSSTEIKRMQDTRFLLVTVITIISSYFNRDDQVEDYLKTYNDDFSIQEDIEKELDAAFAFINDMKLSSDSRVWKRADLFTLLVELHRILFKDKLKIDPGQTGAALSEFYNSVDKFSATDNSKVDAKIANYHKASYAATNDRGTRILRGQIIREVITKGMEQKLL